MGLEINRAFSVGALQPNNRVDRNRYNIGFGTGLNADTFQSTSVKSLATEQYIRKAVNSNPKIRAIVKDFNPDLNLNIEELNDVEFSDDFYFDTGEVDQEHQWVISEARQIRRICREYSEYLYANYVRDQYFEYLKEKYGDMFDIYYSNGLISDWMPPVPIFVNSSMEDIESVLNGVLEINDFDDDALIEYIGKYTDQDVIDNMKVIGGVETRRNVILHAGDSNSDFGGVRTVGGVNSKIGSVNVNDLDELQTMFRGWYQEEKEELEEVNKNQFFKDTPSAIIEEYYSRDALDSEGEFEDALNKGYFDADDDDYNPNEMIIDSSSKIPMTRAEQRKRKFIRTLEKQGWNPVQLMKQMNVGSSYEIRLLEEKNRRKKLSKKKAKELMSEMMGEDISSFSTLEELNEALYDD